MKYVSKKEFAARFGISRPTLERLIDAGTIPSYKLGKKTTRIPLEEAEKALREHNKPETKLFE